MLKNCSKDYVANIINNVYEKTGNCRVNGFLGEGISNIIFDENGNIEFMTIKNDNDTQIKSWCTLLDGSILVKQVETKENIVDTRLYSYDINKNVYTYLSLATQESLRKFYDVMKRLEINLCDGDITDNFKNMGLTFDDVIQVLLEQPIDLENDMNTNYSRI